MFTQSFIQTQIKENIKAPRHWPLCGEFTGTGEIPAQRASYAENVSIWWRHHVLISAMGPWRLVNWIQYFIIEFSLPHCIIFCAVTSREICQSYLRIPENVGQYRFSRWYDYWSGYTLTSWWLHQMESFSALLAICAGNSSHYQVIWHWRAQ